MGRQLVGGGKGRRKERVGSGCIKHVCGIVGGLDWARGHSFFMYLLLSIYLSIYLYICIYIYIDLKTNYYVKIIITFLGKRSQKGRYCSFATKKINSSLKLNNYYNYY